ncbi:MAG: NADPH-dependent assimilatory sulfite reductase hemoprotein subunit [Phycisphaerales bacterium]|nr:NADPH-dependent assimilatory sulfite reductase hemoprotein subunit [Phycisphaerales bacterium]
MPDKTEESKVETAKRGSRQLRGGIGGTLKSDADHFEKDDEHLLKFHGIYQQDDRDTRKDRRADGLGPEHIFMIRCAIPAGAVTADQYLRLDALADRYANGSLRVTTRQGFQFHGVVKRDLKTTIAGINDELITTLSACGDVERNVMACPAPLDDAAHAAMRGLARDIAVELRPKSNAYHEIWLDGEKQISTEPEEPFYGDRYLPRKFKTGIALDTDNCIDAYSYDIGLIARMNQGRVRCFVVVIAGGMGMTHNKGDTFAALAQPLGTIRPDDAVETVRTVAALFRDHGNRADRKHARLKYLLAEWGMDAFRDAFRKATAVRLDDPEPLERIPVDDHMGRHDHNGGRPFYGVFIQNGRIVDKPDCRIKTALKTIVERYRPGVVLTPHQNLLLTNVTAATIDEIERTLVDHGVQPVERLSAARRFSMACPALPTCGLALSESERVMPSIVDRMESELAGLGLRDAPITIRMTGCPNGCARPYTADIAFVGKGPDNYAIYVGGRIEGDRVADLFATDVKMDDFADALRPLLTRWARDRRPDECLGDYYQRLMGIESPRRSISGKEEPTDKAVALKVLP